MGHGYQQRDQGDECTCEACQPAHGHDWHPLADSCLQCGVVDGFTASDPRGPLCPGPDSNVLAVSHLIILAGIAEAADMVVF